MGSNQHRNGKLKDILNIKSPVIGSVSAARRSKLDDATLDVGALMRKALQAPKLRVPGDIPGTGHSAAPDEDFDKNLEFRGNPIYSPEDSLAKAASKLANIKASGGVIKPPEAAGVPDQRKGSADSVSPEIQGDETRKPRQSDVATPGWRPEAEGSHAVKDQEVPLAAKTLITKRNRRKSVYQRPARYGEWFDGDDDELDKMVDGYNEDEENDGPPHEAMAEAHRQELKDRANRRKSAFPAVDMKRTSAKETTMTPEAGSASVQVGSDIANKVRAIANGLCEQLDGLIEESPAVGKLEKPDEGKSLRDKLLESWEGRSYYDRLMQMAAENGEKPSVIAAENSRPLASSKEHDSKSRQGGTATTNAIEAEKDDDTHGHVAENHPVLSFLSPPKPKLRVDVERLPPVELAPKAKTTTAVVRRPSAFKETTEATNDTSRLLKVSARGNKAMMAPWQGDHRESAVVAVASPLPASSVDRRVAPPATEEQTPFTFNSEKSVATGTADIETVGQHEFTAMEMERLKSALAEAIAAKEKAEEAAAKARAETAELKAQLEVAEEEIQAQEEANTAAEKQIAVLEKEVQVMQQQRSSHDGDAVKMFKKVGECAAHVEGRFGLAEVQLEALLSAANAIAEHLAQGRAEAQEVVEVAQSAVPEAAEAGRRKTRGRRKSTWR